MGAARAAFFALTPMSTSRPKLMLDEQSFQDMLAAAFTIQEHNAKRKKEAPPPARACGQCGALVDGDSQLCERCAGEPRPGEELQRKWASLWLMSQEQGLWPERTLDTARDLAPAPQFKPIADNVPGKRFPDPLEISIPEEDFGEPIDIEPVELEMVRAQPNSTENELRILPDVSELAADFESSAQPAEEIKSPVPWSLPDLRLKLLFHRADLYLVVAIVVSTFAMLWVLSATPAAGAHRKPRLRPWESALISLGLAEAPEPPPRRGNPNISVWVDPKTALYYCAGEELYGKAPGGRVATQGEAQMDQFEPAGRVACE